MEEVLVPIFVPLIMFSAVTAMIVTPRWLRSREMEKLLDTIRAISAAGSVPAPELLQALEAYQGAPALALPSPMRDMRRGFMLIAVAAAMLVLAGAFFVTGHAVQAVGPIVGAAAFPAFLGLTQLLFWVMSRHAA